MNPQQPSLSENLIHALEGLPKFALSYVVGFIVIAITDVIVTSLAVGCVFLGMLTSPLVALTAFFLIYAVIRTLNGVGNSISSAGNMVAQAHLQGGLQQTSHQ
jgi:hypothetical protein